MIDKNYHEKNLNIILRDLKNYTPDEYARALLRLVCVADPIVMTEPEFTQQRLKAISEQVNRAPLVPSSVIVETDNGSRTELALLANNQQS